MIIDVQQGSEQWKAFRNQHFTASDAAAILEIEGAYRSKESVLSEKKYGYKELLNAFTRQIFADGHAAEDSARAIIEEQYGIALAPVVEVLDGTKLAASYDGITLDGEIIWEHKHFTGSKRAQKRLEMARSGEVADYDLAQIQQQLLVSSAKKCLFTVSDGTEMVMATVEVLPDQNWFERIRNGWSNFERELAIYSEDVPAGWNDCAYEWLIIREQIAALSEREATLKKHLEELAEQTGRKKIAGGGVTCTKVTRKGAVDYSKIPELAGVELDKYRKKESIFWKIG